MAGKNWSDLSTRQKRGITLGAVVQLVLLGAALSDIYRRPEEQIRGSKWPWVLASFVNFVGPASYFLYGRKR
ncbi:MAG: hypothetical protein AVDCRST_MAG01-01-2789 [uncultured Rubrobacteraceae bacterium]|uniref:Cardiolipin synthase N-terminal domain-containing protein n=1 Tax=uncultured Rubrobacteraceae bacterium TaxID=349277 RepID=A0A6J4Q2I2_9ACTN|nr:MAG: hypothetical protein AVDCRST_MAG01-01-2789 [uncultured Rubrobacteraceae bacterium]